MCAVLTWRSGPAHRAFLGHFQCAADSWGHPRSTTENWLAGFRRLDQVYDLLEQRQRRIATFNEWYKKKSLQLLDEPKRLYHSILLLMGAPYTI